MYCYGCYMKEHDELTNNTVVTTVMSNFGLYKAKNGCRIGGEQSGHIIFSKYASTVMVS